MEYINVIYGMKSQKSYGKNINVIAIKIYIFLQSVQVRVYKNDPVIQYP